MPNASGVIPLQSSNTRKIDLHGEHWEINYRRLLCKSTVTFEYNAAQT